MFIPNREELAWAAGFFDGEGCTTTSCSGRSRHKYPAAVISQAGEHAVALLTRFNRAIGNIGRVIGPVKNSGLGKLPHYYVKLTSLEAVQAAISMMWPFLGPAKRAQAKRVFLTSKTQDIKRRVRGSSIKLDQ